MATCPACGHDIPPGARFCPACGRMVSESAAGERKLATLLFADLVGSTAMTVGRDPEDVRVALGRYFDVARTVVEEHGGTVEKFIGDAVMAVFGVPRSHGDDPDRAVAAALVLRDRVQALPDGLAVRVGIASGEVFATGAGADLTVTGEAVNAAARVQEAAAPGQVLVERRTASACRRMAFGAGQAVPAKGFAGDLEVLEAVGRGEAAPRHDAPLVGRDDDLALLRLLVRRAFVTPAPALVTLVGEAGIGKSRLARELIADLQNGERPARVLVGRNPPYGRGIALWAVGEIIRQAAGSSSSDPPSAVRDALAARLRAAGAEGADEIAAGLALALGGTTDAGDVCSPDDIVRRAWRRLLAVLAAEQPLVILVEDVHWADDGLLDLVEDSVQGFPELPLVLLCTSRPELLERRPEWTGGLRGATAVELRPLPPEEARVLARALLPGSGAAVADRVALAAGGNPFFTEEVAQGVAGEPAGDAPLPDTVQAALAARIDALPADEKRVLLHASVLGTAFTTDALEALIDDDAGAALRGLGRRDLVVERPAEAVGAHGFRHQLVRDVAYAAVPRTERARVHERVADWLAASAARTGRVAELAEVIAFHREQAHALRPDEQRRETAARALVEAGEHAARRGASDRAQELFACGADLQAADAQRLPLLRAAAEIATARMRGDQAVELRRAAAAAARGADDPAAEAVELSWIVELHTRMPGITGPVPPEQALRELTDRARSVLPAADAAAGARVALAVAWLELTAEGSADDAVDRALSASRAADDPLALSSALDAYSANLLWQGHVGEARRAADERLDLLPRLPAGAGMAVVERTDTATMVLRHRTCAGDLPGALEILERARASHPDEPTSYARWSYGLGLLFLLGEWDRAVADLERFRAAWELAGRPRASFARGDLFWAATVSGLRGDDAGWRRGVDLAEGMGTYREHDSWLNWRSVAAIGRALVAAGRGRLAEALEALSASPGAVSGWHRSLYAAYRADLGVRAGHPDAARYLEEAAEAVDEDLIAGAILARARALGAGDPEALAAARAALTALGAAYEAARTAVDMGGGAAGEGRAELARLGVSGAGV